jgi:exopolysaccharide biosynthesis polyprenyl glycosylphosphotransferase
LSFPGTIESRIASVVDLLPAKPRRPNVPLHRAKAATAAVRDETLRGWRTIPSPPRASLLTVLQTWLLPRPSVRGRRWKLASDVSGDFAAVCAAAYMAGQLCGLDGDATPTHLLRLATQYGIVLTLLGYSERLYEPLTIRSPKSERLVAGKCVLWSSLIWAALSGVAAGLRPAFVLVFNLLAFAGLMARRVIRRWIAGRCPNPADAKNVLIVGAGALGHRVADYLERTPLEKKCVVGFVDDDAPVSGGVRGGVRDLQRLVETEFIDEIILAGASGATTQQAIREARRCGVDIKLVPELYGSRASATSFEQFGDIPVLTLREERIPALGLAIKRILDVLGAALGLILTSPLLAAIAGAICLDSPGPVFYTASRVGYKGRRFKCYKFRTMVADADARKHNLLSQNERQGACFKIENDPRITAAGRWLRRYSLDELPQLWNVLRGEMSLVGPRPHPLDDFNRYRRQDMKRLSAMPGLTGLWQVTARRDPSFELNLTLDREYIEHWSLAGDFKILFKTVAAVVQGSGS